MKINKMKLTDFLNSEFSNATEITGGYTTWCTYSTCSGRSNANYDWPDGYSESCSDDAVA